MNVSRIETKYYIYVYTDVYIDLKY